MPWTCTSTALTGLCNTWWLRGRTTSPRLCSWPEPRQGPGLKSHPVHILHHAALCLQVLHCAAYIACRCCFMLRILSCTVSHFTALHLDSIVLHCTSSTVGTAMYCIVGHCTAHAALYCSVAYYAAWCCTTLHNLGSCCTTLFPCVHPGMLDPAESYCIARTAALQVYVPFSVQL